MPYVDTLPSKAEIFDHWKDRFGDIGIFIDWGEPSCWGCGFHYEDRYDIRSSSAGWAQIFNCWEKIPLQRCHIVPRSLGGTDEPSNLFLMCRECHDLAPNTAFPEVFFEGVRAQSAWRREAGRLEEALRSFGVEHEQRDEVLKVILDPGFLIWAAGRFGLHRPQSNYASRSFRLTPTTMVGLAIQYLKTEQTPPAASISNVG